MWNGSVASGYQGGLAMGWKHLFSREPRYIRRTRGYLQEARLAMLEHRIAAEHYQASADMYAERARRLEEEIAAWEAEHQSHDEVAESASVGLGKQVSTARASGTPASVGIIRAA